MPDTKSDVSKRGVHAWGNGYPKIANNWRCSRPIGLRVQLWNITIKGNWSTSYSKGGLQGQDKNERDISRAMSDGTWSGEEDRGEADSNLEGIWLSSVKEDTRCAKELGMAQLIASASDVA